MTSMAETVIQGLSRAQKSLPPRLLYDERGSELFERICKCPEYYVTRTEFAILEENVGEISRLLGEKTAIFEPGSGASQKTRLLLDTASPVAYIPIDISPSILSESVSGLRRDYPHLRILPVCADFMTEWPIPPDELPEETEKRVVFFPGSTLGNFEPGEAFDFLRRMARFLATDGQLLLGIDLIKPKEILDRAYDDGEGITAQFNLNLLHRLQRELGAKLDPGAFRHLAFFDERLQRVEMHLVSTRAQKIEILGRSFGMERGETIHTESSYKYSPAQIEFLAEQAGLRKRMVWTDSRGFFAVVLLEV